MTFSEVLEQNKTIPVKKFSFSQVEDKFSRLPEEIFQLQDLEEIDFGKVSLGKDISLLVKLTNLKVIRLQNYRLKSFPTVLKNLWHLTDLSISGPKLTELPHDLKTWENLTYLNLMGCESLRVVHELPMNLTYLAIGDTGLTEIPKKVYELKNIRKLVATQMELKEIPIEVFQMSSLLSLFLSDNKLSTIPNDINRLDNLLELFLMNNCFSEFPEAIVGLDRLVTLKLNQNVLDVIPDSIANLRNLTELDLSDNCFLEFPYAVLKLESIEVINLRNIYRHAHFNESKNLIRTIPQEIIGLKNLTELGVSNNPIENVPLEIINAGYGAIKNFFESKLEADNEEFLFEAKMVIVGRGNVGKTVLTQRLINPEYVLTESESTEGISVLKSPFTTKLIVNDSEAEFKLNIWDFGGQEKYDATHQLFITKRSVYLFLTEAREESNYMDFYFWLNTIRLFSDNSPIIIVLSKIDERKKSLPESVYRQQFDNIVDFVDVSCAEGFEGTIKNLKNTINSAISALPQTKLKLSNRWIEVRNKLEELSKSVDYISYSEYLEICLSHKLDKKRADFLSQFLNDLGAIIHHQQDLLLKETVFINTDWCVDGMYKILDNETISENNGKFTSDDLELIWDEKRFESKRAELLKLMHQYHLCFELRDSTGYIAPDLLPPDRKSDFYWDSTNNLQFQYDYDFMPAGILSRFIVKSHSFIKDSLYWKHGVVLDHEGTLALVQEDYIKSKIKISLKGKNKKGLLSAIRMYIKEVHRDFDKSNKLSFKEMVPCNCVECSKSGTPHFYSFNVLKRFEEKGNKTIGCNLSAENVSVDTLINDVELAENKRKLQTNQDLKDFVMNIISNVLEKEITLKGSNVNFWRDQAFKEPKNESEIQPYITNTLDHYCKFNGINVSREVKEANGNVDILLSTRNDDNKLLKVCIEIKKAHHNDVDSAIKSQLPEYMKSAETDAGVYLVVWLKNEHHPHPKRYSTVDALYSSIISNNTTNSGISVKILNCCKIESPSKIKVKKD